MRLLLDTNIVIRLSQGERQIDRATHRIIEGASAIYVSSASIWEIAIKTSIRKLAIDVSRLERGLLEAGIKPLPITWAHACRVHDIVLSHPDPFDRLLAQAVCEPLHLLRRDERLVQYGGGLVIAV